MHSVNYVPCVEPTHAAQKHGVPQTHPLWLSRQSCCIALTLISNFVVPWSNSVRKTIFHKYIHLPFEAIILNSVSEDFEFGGPDSHIAWKCLLRRPASLLSPFVFVVWSFPARPPAPPPPHACVNIWVQVATSISHSYSPSHSQIDVPCYLCMTSFKRIDARDRVVIWASPDRPRTLHSSAELKLNDP